jgi:ParB family transcriptional regulator, chromosome partitioning protein
MAKKQQAPDLSYIAEALRSNAVPIESLVSDPRNARKHDTRNLEAVVASMRQFGQTQVIVVRDEDNVVCAGNARLLAAKELGWTHVAVVRQPWSAIQAQAYGIADNRTAELAEWDHRQLAELLDELSHVDVTIPGFDDDEIADLIALATFEGETDDALRRQDQDGRDRAAVTTSSVVIRLRVHRDRADAALVALRELAVAFEAEVIA